MTEVDRVAKECREAYIKHAKIKNSVPWDKARPGPKAAWRTVAEAAIKALRN